MLPPLNPGHLVVEVERRPHEVGVEVALALHEDLAALLHHEHFSAAHFQQPSGLLGDLDAATNAGAVHSARHVHRVAPDVVLRPGRILL